MKGKLGGKCNISSCQSEGSTYYYNMVTEKYYCRKHALMINDNCNTYGKVEFFDIKAGDKLARRDK